ncbi:hypothetical protein SAMN05428978_10152 [Nitrosomonas sp. Nm34]|nr:hypothetical protein SAMN05428978_10152 [Nitrosomonas sp. Nm34]
MLLVKIVIKIMLQLVFVNHYKIHATYLIVDEQNFTLFYIFIYLEKLLIYKTSHIKVEASL